MDIKIQDSKFKEIDLEQNREIYECYYCNNFQATTNQRVYEKHVVLDHQNKLVYPSLTDLKKHNLKPHGKKWEI